VNTVEEFARQNEEQLKMFMKYKTRIHDEDIINDTVQEFYVKLIETKALEAFDENQGEFSTYVTRLFCWLFPVLRKRNFRNIVTRTIREEVNGKKIKKKVEVIYEVLSTFKSGSDRMWRTTENDIWDYVSSKNSYLNLHSLYCNSHVMPDVENDLECSFQRFIKYIEKTEPVKRAERMVFVLKHRYDGCKSRDIAIMLGVSDNMVKLIKNSVREKYQEWEETVVA